MSFGRWTYGSFETRDRSHSGRSSPPMRGGKTHSRKGPADTAKLQLGAYYRLKAKSPEEAAEMALRIPGVPPTDPFEVRPVWDFS